MALHTENSTNHSQEEFINLYDLLEWASQSYNYSLTNTTYDLINILSENMASVDVYEYFDGIKPRTVKSPRTLKSYLEEINKARGYDIELPF
ncbi:hypothetical protein [Rodentibacter trehalosifermentans]|uniref:hypothetical protein n=1 Tax=Rodentibacter trehalosifermentans TaxID=1908263 RepID=UPI000986B872|nr:hypothetical protein [Rodentibacter trehalosifermentans]OOF53632.1 hypothetical protein BKK53_00495 [Rodentibacter trehalosifermentans]